MSVWLPLQIPNPVFLAEPHLLSDLPPLLAPLIPGLHLHPSLPPLFVPGPRLQPDPSPRRLFNQLILPTNLQPWSRPQSKISQRTLRKPCLQRSFSGGLSGTFWFSYLPKILTRRLHRRAPNPSQDSGPSAVPPPSPPVATTTPPIATTTPIPSQADATPAPPEVPTESPLAKPSTSQQHQSTEAGPSHRPSSTTSPPELSHMPLSAPSGSAAGPSQPPPPVHHYYRTTAPSEA
ncbi:proline-rich extensin-like protein EPR1 [Zingiber officinale]|uniref:proline-rich extensin-like protein EPR1 n=1 Tax=Zingiber officinale TaxID=94328 RepID=UPI001C4C7A21|nr:proline-rich extensin-like protein EPR1 [Zingiber officinale]